MLQWHPAHAILAELWSLLGSACCQESAGLTDGAISALVAEIQSNQVLTAPLTLMLEQDEQGRWNKFGGRLPWGPEAICSNNPTFGGKGNHKTGEDYVAAPNIDHTNPRVREDIKAWMKWLRSSIGFDGWRFDFVKGYSMHLSSCSTLCTCLG